MKIYILICMAMLLPFGAMAEVEVQLKDGSRIVGEIQAMENGVYKIKTRSMGIVEVANRQMQGIKSSTSSTAHINTITNTTSNATNSTNPGMSSPANISAIQSAITNNPGVMANIMTLQNDPQMQSALSDPEVMNAIRNFDFKTLANNPRIKALMNNPKIRETQGSVQ